MSSNINNNTVGFRNKNQVVLFEKELKGQISDGHWENSRPFGHWEIPCSAVAYVAANDSEIGRNFQSRKYNFSDPDLLEVVGNRMQNLVKLGQAFPHIPVDELFDIDSNPKEEIENWIKYSTTDKSNYWQNKLNKTMALCLARTPEDLIEILTNALNSVSYGEKELKKDLNEMVKCWRVVRS